MSNLRACNICGRTEDEVDFDIFENGLEITVPGFDDQDYFCKFNFSLTSQNDIDKLKCVEELADLLADIQFNMVAPSKDIDKIQDRSEEISKKMDKYKDLKIDINEGKILYRDTEYMYDICNGCILSILTIAGEKRLSVMDIIDKSDDEIKKKSRELKKENDKTFDVSTILNIVQQISIEKHDRVIKILKNFVPKVKNFHSLKSHVERLGKRRRKQLLDKILDVY